MTKILLVEDDASVRQSLKNYLEPNGFEVLEAGSLSEAEALLGKKPRCVVLDWNLPDGEGIDFARALRAKSPGTPVIMLTARTELIDKVVGLEAGAHDYLTKPYEPRELLARIRSLIRLTEKYSQENRQSVAHHGVEVDLQARVVAFRNKRVDLTKMEFELLRLFLENPGKAFSRDELLNMVWGYDQFPSTRTVDTHVLQLRTKLFDDLIETVRGIGYRCKK